VDPVGQYQPLPFGFGKHKKGTRPSDHALVPTPLLEEQ